MQDHKMISRSGVAAGLICAVIPLAVTGLLLFRFVKKTGSTDEVLIWTIVTLFLLFPASLAFQREVDKYYRQRQSGDDALPTPRLKLLYGAALGVAIFLLGHMSALLWLYFAM